MKKYERKRKERTESIVEKAPYPDISKYISLLEKENS